MPRFGSGHDLDETTQLYIDVYIALELLHMRYPVYIASTSPLERTLYQFYLMLKSEKEEHARKRQEEQAQQEREAAAFTGRM